MGESKNSVVDTFRSYESDVMSTENLTEGGLEKPLKNRPAETPSKIEKIKNMLTNMLTSKAFYVPTLITAAIGTERAHRLYEIATKYISARSDGSLAMPDDRFGLTTKILGLEVPWPRMPKLPDVPNPGSTIYKKVLEGVELDVAKFFRQGYTIPVINVHVSQPDATASLIIGGSLLVGVTCYGLYRGRHKIHNALSYVGENLSKGVSYLGKRLKRG